MSDPGSRGNGSLVTGRLVVVALAVLLVVGVAVGVGMASGLVGVPTVVDVSNQFDGVNGSTTVLDTNVTVRNPNPVPATIGGIDLRHTVYMNGIRMGQGVRDGLRLEPGRSQVAVTTGLRNERIPEWWVSHVRRSERTNLTVAASVGSSTFDRRLSETVADRTVRTDLISAFETNRTVPVEANSQLIDDPVLYVERTQARWANVTANRTVIAASLLVRNPKPLPIPITTVTYHVAMNDVAVASGSTRNLSAIPANSRRNVTALLVIDNSKLDEWWVSHVERNQSTTVRFDYAVSVRLSRFGLGSREFSPPPLTRTFETDIFGEGTDSSGLAIE